MGEAIEIQRLVGFGYTQAVVGNTIFFMRNCRIVTADEVQFIRKTVLVESCKVLFDKVLLTGRLRKDVGFRETPACSGNVASVGSALAEVAFQAIIDVWGARPGDTCVVVKAFVEGEEESPLIERPGGGIKGLVDSSVVFLCVKVVRASMRKHRDRSRDDCDDSGRDDHSWCDDSEDDDDICNCSDSLSCSCGKSIRSGDGSHGDSGKSHRHRKQNDRHFEGCPKRMTAGLVAGKNGKVPDARPGPLPGTFVGPTILFPGVF